MDHPEPIECFVVEKSLHLDIHAVSNSQKPRQMRDVGLLRNRKDGHSHDRLIYPVISNLSTKAPLISRIL